MTPLKSSEESGREREHTDDRVVEDTGEVGKDETLEALNVIPKILGLTL